MPAISPRFDAMYQSAKSNAKTDNDVLIGSGRTDDIHTNSTGGRIQLFFKCLLNLLPGGRKEHPADRVNEDEVQSSRALENIADALGEDSELGDTFVEAFRDRFADVYSGDTKFTMKTFDTMKEVVDRHKSKVSALNDELEKLATYDDSLTAKADQIDKIVTDYGPDGIHETLSKGQVKELKKISEAARYSQKQFEDALDYDKLLFDRSDLDEAKRLLKRDVGEVWANLEDNLNVDTEYGNPADAQHAMDLAFGDMLDGLDGIDGMDTDEDIEPFIPEADNIAYLEADHPVEAFKEEFGITFGEDGKVNGFNVDKVDYEAGIHTDEQVQKAKMAKLQVKIDELQEKYVADADEAQKPNRKEAVKTSRLFAKKNAMAKAASAMDMYAGSIEARHRHTKCQALLHDIKYAEKKTNAFSSSNVIAQRSVNAVKRMFPKISKGNYSNPYGVNEHAKNSMLSLAARVEKGVKGKTALKNKELHRLQDLVVGQKNLIDRANAAAHKEMIEMRNNALAGAQ